MQIPPLTIRIKKHGDGTSSLSCLRADGSVTWQRQPKPAHARFFLLHDLTHYAVETELKFGRGFYGLIAEGWDFTDFATPRPRGPIPSDAAAAELIVGFFDTQRAAGEEWSAEEFNEHLREVFKSHGDPAPGELTENQLENIRREVLELLERWETLPAGDAMELAFGMSR